MAAENSDDRKETTDRRAFCVSNVAVKWRFCISTNNLVDPIRTEGVELAGSVISFAISVSVLGKTYDQMATAVIGERNTCLSDESPMVFVSRVEPVLNLGRKRLARVAKQFL
jgi:hypothetical protein